MRRISLTLTAMLALIAGLAVPALRFSPAMAQDDGACSTSTWSRDRRTPRIPTRDLSFGA